MRTKQVVFRAYIDHANPESHNREAFDWDVVRRQAEKVILHELPASLQEMFNVKVVTRVNGFREGSLSIFFTAVTVYTLFGGYKGFYESVELISSQARELLARALNPSGQRFVIDVASVYPQVVRPSDLRERHIREALNYMHYIVRSDRQSHRYIGDGDVFVKPACNWFLVFWVSLALGELSIIVLLVYRAVVKTYFG